MLQTVNWAGLAMPSNAQACKAGPNTPAGGELPYAKVEEHPKESESGPNVWLNYYTPPKLPSESQPGSPVGLDAVKLKAIEPDIEVLYQTPAEFKSALGAVK